MRFGIFGGTFDPPHLGHLILASEALFQLKLDRVLWMLTPYPPHKEDQVITSTEQRLELLESAIAMDSAFELSRVDIEREAPHYAVDSMQLLRVMYPQVDMVYLMGGDSLRDLLSWHHPREFVLACDALGVMPRPGFKPDLTGLSSEIPNIQAKVHWVGAPLIEISASDIRKRVACGAPYRYLVPNEVYHLIQSRRLYQI